MLRTGLLSVSLLLWPILSFAEDAQCSVRGLEQLQDIPEQQREQVCKEISRSLKKAAIEAAKARPMILLGQSSLTCNELVAPHSRE